MMAFPFIDDGLSMSNNSSDGGLSEATPENFTALKNNLNVLFLVLMGTIILFMQAGFAFIEAGLVRTKNSVSILSKNIADMIFGGVAFWAVGYAFAFGEGNPFIGTQFFFLSGLEYRIYAYMFFQATFAATTATIIAGAIAERAVFSGYIVYSLLVTGVIYPVHAHWCWGPGGWLKDRGYHDFAGSGVVHLSGGVCSLVACWLIGPRVGRFKNGVAQDIPQHSLPLVVLGYFMLFYGFLAFNTGSQTSITEPGDGDVVAIVVVATVMASCGGGIAGIFAAKVTTRKWRIVPLINGSLAGMVAICCGADAVYPWAALVIGLVAGLVSVVLPPVFLWLKLDDPVDALAVHIGGGLWGLISGPLLRIGGVNGTMLLYNVVGIVAIAAWNAATALLVFGSLKWVGMLRVDDYVEDEGIDSVDHGDLAYDDREFPISAAEKQQPVVNRNIISPYNNSAPDAKVMSVREATNVIRY